MKDLVSIVILNWNAKEITSECLKSVFSQSYSKYEVIVVDNGSEDGSPEYLKKKFPRVKMVTSKENRGYAGGNNLGMKKAKGNYILILNNDTIIDKDFLSELVKNKDKADILGVKNYYFDQKDIIWAVGSKVNKITLRAKLVGNKRKDSKEINEESIDHAVGSAIFLKKEVLEKAGFLNEDFFIYYEETEWQTRAQRAGFKISWVPSAKLWHKVAYSTGGGRSSISSYYLVRNRGYYIKRWSKVKIIAYPIWIAEIFARVALGILNRDIKFSKMALKGATDFLKGVKGKLVK